MDNVPEVKIAIKENRCMFGTIDTWLIWVSTCDFLPTNKSFETILEPNRWCKWGFTHNRCYKCFQNHANEYTNITMGSTSL